MKHRSNYIRVHKPIHAFTLVELLVVISIIALLLSVLMPSLQKARELAKRTVCASQFKQIAVIQTLYSSDFKSWIPRYTDRGNMDKPNHMTGVRVWPGNMLAKPFEYCRNAFGMDDKIWVCPGFSGVNKDSIKWEPGFEGKRLMKSGDTGQWPSGYWTLGSVSLVGLVACSSVEPRNGVPNSALRITDPGHYLLAADKNFRSLRDWNYKGGQGAPASAIAHPKKGLPTGSNCAHIDGSVSWTQASEMAFNRRTIRYKKPEVIPVGHKDAVGKYDEWPPSGREFFF